MDQTLQRQRMRSKDPMAMNTTSRSCVVGAKKQAGKSLKNQIRKEGGVLVLVLDPLLCFLTILQLSLSNFL